MLAALMLVVTGSATAAPATHDTEIRLNVLPAIAWAPGLTKGRLSVDLPELRNAGQVANVTSDGWHISSTWPDGYDILVSATSDPAMKGRNATDGSGVPSSFRDYTIGGCPCPWNIGSFSQGVFGYSASGSNGLINTTTWGSSSSRKWRGLTKGKYKIGSTGGVGEFDMDLHFRTAIPEDGTQEAGSYRASVILSISATL